MFQMSTLLKIRRCRLADLGQVVVSMLILASGFVYAQWNIENCGSLLVNFHAPYDYTSPDDQERLKGLESHHFTPEVERLTGHNKCGGNRCMLSGDIDFTLRHYPNHHRALLAMVNYHLRGLDKIDEPMRYTPNCYFDRAIRFRPDDGIVLMIFGHYLNKSGDSEGALIQYKKALAMAPNSSEAHYNLGLLYTEMGEYQLARDHAQKAYSLGFPLPGLRSKLQRAGQWDEPEKSVQEE